MSNAKFLGVCKKSKFDRHAWEQRAQEEMDKPKYIVFFIQKCMIANRFEYGKGQKPEAIATAKNLAIRYGEKAVQVGHMYYDDGEPMMVDVTESFLMA